MKAPIREPALGLPCRRLDQFSWRLNGTFFFDLKLVQRNPLRVTVRLPHPGDTCKLGQSSGRMSGWYLARCGVGFAEYTADLDQRQLESSKATVAIDVVEHDGEFEADLRPVRAQFN